MNELISKLKNEEFINFHGVIEAGGFAYAILATLAEAEQELAKRQVHQEAHPEEYETTDIKWVSAATRELQIGDTYKSHTVYEHGADDGLHGSKQKYLRESRTSPRPSLIVNI